MNRWLRLILAVLVAANLACAAESVPADEKKPPEQNPLYAQWARLQPGTVVKYEIVTKVDGGETEVTTATKLLQVTPEKVVLEVASSMVAGDSPLHFPPERLEVHAHGKVEKASELTLQNRVVREGKERLEQAGRPFDCAWRETRGTVGGQSVITKTWFHDAVPGGIVKEQVIFGPPAASETNKTLVRFGPAE